MGVAIAVVGAVFGMVGVVGVVAPGAATGSLDAFKASPAKIYGWASFRVLIGVGLMAGASSTAYPSLIRLVGAVLVLKAALVPLLGLDRVRSILDWLQARPPYVVRSLFLLVALFGAGLVWAVLGA